MKNEVKGKAIVDFEKIILNVHEVAYNEGEKKGRENSVEEYKQEQEREQEKFATNYVVEQFTDCKTLPEFQDKLREITNRSYNFL